MAPRYMAWLDVLELTLQLLGHRKHRSRETRQKRTNRPTFNTNTTTDSQYSHLAR
jgi:hypothetical protein